MGTSVASAALGKVTKARTGFIFVCQACRYDESVTANTVFYKLKIPLLKAFGMSFRKHPLDNKVEVDELLIGGPEKDKRGRNKGEKKLVVIAVEKVER